VDLFSLDGKVAVVTGGTRGIGLMIARGLLQAGARKVYISSRKAGACAAAAQELSSYGDVTAIPADLSKEAECRRLAEEVGAAENELHILVNNAGATWGTPMSEFTEEAWDKVMDTNVKGVFFLTQRLLPLLEAGATADEPSRVINIGSIDGIAVPRLGTFSYSSSKAALHQLTRHMAHALAPRILVNAIAPGPFQSKMMAATLEAVGDRLAAAACDEAAATSVGGVKSSVIPTGAERSEAKWRDLFMASTAT